MKFVLPDVVNRFYNVKHAKTCYYGKTDFYEPCTCPPGQGNMHEAELREALSQALGLLDQAAEIVRVEDVEELKDWADLVKGEH